MRNVWLSLSVVLTLAGCARKVAVTHDPAPAPASAVQTTLQRQARNAVEAGEGDYELRQLREAVAASPDDVEARLKLAAHYGARGMSDLALEHYRLAAERFPDSVAAARALVTALRKADATGEAKDVLVRFCNRSSRAPAEFFSLVGILEDADGRYANAELWHRAANERQPDSSVLHNNLGYNLLLQGRATDAAAEFRRALALDPRSEIARNNLGVALAADPKEAVLAWEAITDAATAHSNMAAVLIEQKRYAEARSEIQAALDYAPRHPAALENLKLLDELEGKRAAAAAPRNTLRGRVAMAVRRALGVSPASN
ncbi:MAG: tetratricopeptide repeat protein [Acidobacteria bacterium]|nr:tetratricopeptide repeat protein [Acidobacteriota bacterium]